MHTHTHTHTHIFARQLESFEILQAAYLGRIITPQQAEKFSKRLQTHQQAITPEGMFG
jgi:hypothetical protein